ncbi:hypothetical protein J500_1114 [Acinetobacter sp. 479375]|nr:hypothetical protein J500_1114 [Acinetobacter sp. 479375]
MWVIALSDMYFPCEIMMLFSVAQLNVRPIFMTLSHIIKVPFLM